MKNKKKQDKPLNCPKCHLLMMQIDQKNKLGIIVCRIAYCIRCHWAISLDHYLIPVLVGSRQRP